MGECITPFTVRSPKNPNESTPVPCGKCPPCINRRKQTWGFRLEQQAKVSASAHFITLTYDTKYVPITSNGYMSLNKRDTVLFLKRLRKANREAKLKYYLVGEYGGKTFRPHYHALIFGADVRTIQPAWGLGSVHYGQVQGQSVQYTLKYMHKDVRIPQHARDDRQPEFANMSKGLGLNYLTDEMVQWHKQAPGKRLYCPVEDGKKIAMPRYYKQKLYNEGQLKAIGQIARKNMLKNKYKIMAKQGQDYYAIKAQRDLAAIRAAEKAAKQNDKL